MRYWIKHISRAQERLQVRKSNHTDAFTVVILHTCLSVVQSNPCHGVLRSVRLSAGKSELEILGHKTLHALLIFDHKHPRPG